MITLPKQLQKKEFRFNKITHKDKKAFEIDWQRTKNYEHNDKELQKHLEQRGNYGVIGGYGNLIIIDADSPEVLEDVNELPETFTVKTSKGEHHYYICNDLKENIKFYGEDKNKDYGQIQVKGKYVVGANCIHPSGIKYEPNNKKISKISKEKLLFTLKKWLKVKQVELEYRKERIDIPIMSVFNSAGFKQTSEGWQGKHPTHGSDTGINFCINKSKDVWHCFRHMVGGDALSLLAIQEGIINCGDNLKGDDFIEALKKAEEMGLYKPSLKRKFITSDDIKKRIDALEECNELLIEHPMHYDRSNMWWLWNSQEKKWEMIDEVDILNEINQALEWNGILNQTIRNQFLTALRMTARKNEPKEAPRTWIQFKDKIIDINTGEEIMPSPEYFLTNPIPWHLGKSEETPMMDKLITSWVGKEKVIEVYETIAYCLLRDYPIQRVIVTIGSGSNGKGQLLCLIRNFIGAKNVTSTDLEKLKRPFEPAKLYKKLVCEVAETNITSLRHTSTIKRLTGGDLVGGEFKNKKPFDFINYAKLIVATNSLPMTMDRTDGFYRRWHIIEFPNKFPDGKAIIEIVPKEEYENLARKCIRLLRELLERGIFTNDGKISDRRDRYEKYSMPIKEFIEENYVKDPAGFTPKGKFNDELNFFLSQNGHRLLTGQEINKTLTMMGLDVKNKKINNNAIKCVFGLSKKGNQGNQSNQGLYKESTHRGLSKGSEYFSNPSNPKDDTKIDAFIEDGGGVQ